ncbi:DUF4974 domain-containing protein [Arenibacter sp. 6A1]|uniref:FecR family protein n=1 Tax=Arenibacter sp. 6A1 TaxID=2720391 RepID=UPI00144810DD|nr:FecR family protein [Arenibacter sp. 6A1]NKI27063.1 DUF4974 domain-containing protein [Arenibacter sp. 6A1]
MNSLKKVFKLSKEIAHSILEGRKVDVGERQTHWSQKEEEYIVQSLTEKNSVLARKKQRKAIEKSKKQDWKRIQKELKLKERYGFVKRLYRAAAVLLAITGASFVYYYNFSSFSEPIGTIDPNAITLRMEDGTVQSINPEVSIPVLDKKGSTIFTQHKGILKYHGDYSSEGLMYSELTVPNGKKIKLELSDGTVVDINSGTTLKFPTNFLTGHKREVFLDGEAFFAVTKDVTHPFTVFTGELGVTVLGTKFNMTSYPEDDHIRTVLVEGSVQVYDTLQPNNTSLLEPGYMASWNKNQKNISMEKIDLDLYTGWIDGKIVFRSLAFRDIIKKLERSYNVSIECRNEILNKEVFSASFNVDVENIEQVLGYINLEHQFSYSKKGNTIIIN